MFLRKFIINKQVVMACIDSGIFILPGNLRTMGRMILRWTRDNLSMIERDANYDNTQLLWSIQFNAAELTELNQLLEFEIDSLALQLNESTGLLHLFIDIYT